MAYWLLFPFREDISWFRIFGYTTFRMVLAAVTAMMFVYLTGPWFINYLRKLKFRESIRSDGPVSHQSKAGTPTMGGLMILCAASVAMLLWGNFFNLFAMMAWMGTIALGAVGFADDFTKAVRKIPGGMKAGPKFLLQLSIAVLFSVCLYSFGDLSHADVRLTGIARTSDLFVPFLKDPVYTLGLLAIPFWVVVIAGATNAVNLTDGLDGLATGISAIVLLTLGVFAYLSGIWDITRYLHLPFIPEGNELSVFLAAMTGACVGFLWFNGHPAEVFMGDTGSLALGGSIGMSAVLIHRELLLVILGGVFVAEAVSVILQVGYYKLTKKRVFRMAPLHHHFELLGWHENKVVLRFWIVGVLLALIAVSTLKVQ